MIKVLHVVGSMNRGGAEVMLMDIYRNIYKNIHFDFLVNFKLNDGITIGDFDNEIIDLGGKISHIPTQWDLGIFKYIKEFKKVIKNLNPDIVHIHMNAKSGVIAMAAKKSGIKNIIIHSHADLKFRGSILYVLASKIELYFQKLLMQKNANCFWGCSIEAIYSLFGKNNIDDTNYKIIKNAINIDSYKKINSHDLKKLKDSYKILNNTIVFGNIGRIVEHKNVSFIIDLLYEFNKINSNFIFVFAGRNDHPDYLNEIFNKAKKYKILNKIKYLGLRDDVPLVMNSFDIFIGPALQEGFGMVAIEAQAANLPCYLYKGFPKTVDMKLGLVTFFKNFEIKNWISAIRKQRENKINFTNIKSAIELNGFDCKKNTELIKSFYLKLIKKNNA